jgi:hypothetical protein
MAAPAASSIIAAQMRSVSGPPERQTTRGSSSPFAAPPTTEGAIEQEYGVGVAGEGEDALCATSERSPTAALDPVATGRLPRRCAQPARSSADAMPIRLPWRLMGDSSGDGRLRTVST